MAEHLTADEHDLAEAIASLPNAEGDAVERRHWSFASKILHFFVDGDRYPIYDSFCRIMVAYHLGLGGRVPDAGNPYRAFMANLERVRELSNIDASLRDLDRYMWLVGQYRDWLKKALWPGDAALRVGPSLTKEEAPGIRRPPINAASNSPRAPKRCTFSRISWPRQSAAACMPRLRRGSLRLGKSVATGLALRNTRRR